MHEHDFPDDGLLELICFGCPANFDANMWISKPPGTLISEYKNNFQVTYSPRITEFYTEEIAKNRMKQVNLDHVIPVKRASPYTTAEKKYSLKRRVCANLSWNAKNSISSPNSVAKRVWPDLSLPTTSDVKNMIIQAGPNCFLFKMDGEAWYRNCPYDVKDVPWLNLFHNGKIFQDYMVSFGFKSGADAGHRIMHLLTQAVAAITGESIENYSDDLYGCHSRYPRAYFWAIEIAKTFGFPMSKSKCFAPTHDLEILGVSYNTVKWIAYLSHEKCSKYVTILKEVRGKGCIRKQEAQRVAGILCHVTSCSVVSAGHRILSRWFNLQRTFPCNNSSIKLEIDMLHDLDIWIEILSGFDKLPFENMISVPDCSFNATCDGWNGGSKKQAGIGVVIWLNNCPKIYSACNFSVPRDFESTTCVELAAIWLAIELITTELRISHVKLSLKTDSLNASRLNSFSERKNATIIRSIMQRSLDHQIDLRCDHFSKDLNSESDDLSRWHATSDGLPEWFQSPSFIPTSDEFYKNLVSLF